MTFESLAVAGLSIGLTMNDILDMKIGLTISMLNERSNQMLAVTKGKKKNEEEVIIGDAKMLMKM